MSKNKELISQSTEIGLSAVSSLVGYAIGGPVGAVVGGVMTPGTKLVYELIEKHNARVSKRLCSVVQSAFIKSGKSEETILKELLNDSEWADSVLLMLHELVYADPELDMVFSEIMAYSIKTDSEQEKRRLIILYNSIKGLNQIQLQILKCIYNNFGKLSAKDIARKVSVPEIELRNAVRDLELRGMIIDDGSEPTIWQLRELGAVIAKSIETMEG